MRSPITYRQTGGVNHIYLASYKDWLAGQPVTPNTARAYHSRIKQFLRFLEYTSLGDKPLNDAADMNVAMRLYLDFLKQSQRGDGTVNAMINALKSFSQFLGIETPELKRRRCYPKSTRMLTLSEQQRFLRVVEQQDFARDKALALVLFYSGLRIGECARLNMENIGAGAACISLGAGVRIPLNQETMLAVREWLEERRHLSNAEVESGLWLTKQGRRLKLASITSIIERIAWQAKLVVSAETLRRTWLAKAVDCHNQDELASKFGGYVSRATLKRYGASLSI